MISPRRPLVAILVALLLAGQLALALPQSQSGPRRKNRATPRKTTTPAADSSAPQNSRGLSVQQIRSGVSLDGRGKLWVVVIGVSSY